MQQHPCVTECTVRDEGLNLTFSDGQSFLFPQAFLYATRFTHARVLPSQPASNTLPGVPEITLHPSIEG